MLSVEKRSMELVNLCSKANQDSWKVPHRGYAQIKRENALGSYHTISC